ncbi:hypothetical protein SAMN02745244_02174 [Tessaracoccus bendigoensis DSM 12906]|uniref:Uncharacterized protein n=1 Tax=Tessaracoccus bendigoensis DSM 12906 TaxID=1123357 RepID=A0A1M6I4Y8_9ACTN|nr:hypothetical protein [Tessaracoccus bendigoensis]SHJ29546.1 hypothetical protein SAMN02745244_02174 [Tessaracoccus bendigoensis DSM 12906]
MSNNPIVPPVGPRDPDDVVPEMAMREVDGEDKLDPEASDDLISSAEADRLAAEGNQG